MISFKHCNYSHYSDDFLTYLYEGTVALSLPSPREFMEGVLAASQTLPIHIGVALKNPKDQYVKKVGRELAQARMATVPFTFHTLSRDNEGRYVLNFSTDLPMRAPNHGSARSTDKVHVNLLVSIMPGVEYAKLLGVELS